MGRVGAPIRASASSGIQRGALQLLEASERTHSAEQAHKGSLSCAFRPPRVQGRLFVQARWMLRMRGRGAGAAAPCTREHACLGSGNAAAASDLDAQAPRSFCWTRSFGSMCRRRRAVRRSSFRGWTRRGAPFCAAVCFRHQMRCAQAVRGIRLHPCCRVGSPQLACGESGVSSDAGGRTWKASRELRGGAGSSVQFRRAASEAVGGMHGAARRVPGMQRFRRKAESIFFRRL
jgi:hypothetical protein